MPVVPFKIGEILPAIPQTEEDKKFGIEDQELGLREGVYEEIAEDYTKEQELQVRPELLALLVC